MPGARRTLDAGRLIGEMMMRFARCGARGSGARRGCGRGWRRRKLSEAARAHVTSSAQGQRRHAAGSMQDAVCRCAHTHTHTQAARQAQRVGLWRSAQAGMQILIAAGAAVRPVPAPAPRAPRATPGADPVRRACLIRPRHAPQPAACLPADLPARARSGPYWTLRPCPRRRCGTPAAAACCPRAPPGLPYPPMRTHQPSVPPHACAATVARCARRPA